MPECFSPAGFVHALEITLAVLLFPTGFTSGAAVQGCDPKQYRNQYEEKLRAAEMEAIQDYIAESDNLVELHKEVPTSCSLEKEPCGRTLHDACKRVIIWQPSLPPRWQVVVCR